jgi:DNA repair protein RecN (Recombination protein N)
VIEEIRIANLGVIEESVLELGPGLNVVTGETGAGKTMLVTALGLLLGARSDAGAVRSGAKAARVEGIVAITDPTGPVAVAVEALGGEIDDGSLVLARQLSAEGRSRAFLGGASVPVSALQGVADHLVAVHGQSDQHRLLQAEAQRAAVDGFAGAAVASLKVEVAAGYAELRVVEAELADVLGASRERAREADVLRLGLAEIEAVEPVAGEDVALAAEEGRLGFADTLRTAAESAREALSSDEENPDALGSAVIARRALESVRDHDAEAGGLADRVAELTYLLSDVAADVASYAAALDTDPARLSVVSARRAALTALTRKYGETIDDVLLWSGSAAQRLHLLDNSDEQIAELRSQRARLREELAARAGALSSARAVAADQLSVAVSEELTALAMPHARIAIRLSRRIAVLSRGL